MPLSKAAQALLYVVTLPLSSTTQTAISNPKASQFKKSGNPPKPPSSSSSLSSSPSFSLPSVSSSSSVSSSPVIILGSQTKKLAFILVPSFSKASIRGFPVHLSITETSNCTFSSSGISNV